MIRVIRIFIWLLIVFYTALYNHFRFSVLEKEKNAKLIREVKVAKEETTQIRANTQQIISTYQVQILILDKINLIIFVPEFWRSSLKCPWWWVEGSEGEIWRSEVWTRSTSFWSWITNKWTWKDSNRLDWCWCQGIRRTHKHGNDSRHFDDSFIWLTQQLKCGGFMNSDFTSRILIWNQNLFTRVVCFVDKCHTHVRSELTFGICTIVNFRLLNILGTIKNFIL